MDLSKRWSPLSRETDVFMSTCMYSLWNEASGLRSHLKAWPDLVSVYDRLLKKLVNSTFNLTPNLCTLRKGGGGSWNLQFIMSPSPTLVIYTEFNKDLPSSSWEKDVNEEVRRTTTDARSLLLCKGPTPPPPPPSRSIYNALSLRCNAKL